MINSPPSSNPDPPPEDGPGGGSSPGDDGLAPAVGDIRDDEAGSADEAESSEEVEQIASLVIARIENKLEQHLHTQMELPSAEQAAELREKAPELYAEWIRIAGQRADTEAYIQRAQYEVPERLARSGRPWALGALVLVLGFCAFVVTFGGAAVYVAGIIAALDIITMLGLFMGMRPELFERTKKPKSISPPSGESRGELPPGSPPT